MLIITHMQIITMEYIKQNGKIGTLTMMLLEYEKSHNTNEETNFTFSKTVGSVAFANSSSRKRPTAKNRL